MTDADTLIRAYYAAFNAGDTEAFLALLTDDVIHDISQGGREVGKSAFRRFMAHMDRCYRETITDITVMANPDGSRAAAEFLVHGTYIATDPGVPTGTAPANGQTYRLPAGAFFTLREGRVARISNHYNLGDWIRQVNA
ncbi:MAG: nuclear transport factor 2 family protein [Alphaproteobacteria bacterium]|nr:nuclear transport factor 2 family protein [Alphaproteobacteria bacterium]